MMGVSVQSVCVISSLIPDIPSMQEVFTCVLFLQPKGFFSCFAVLLLQAKSKTCCVCLIQSNAYILEECSNVKSSEC